MTANDDPDQILAGCKDVAHYLRGVFRFFADYMADQPLCCIGAETLTLSHTVHGYKSTAPYVAAIKDIARPGPNKQAPVERIAHDTLTTIREEVNRLADEIEQEPSPKVAQRLIRQLVYVFLHFAVGTQARLRRIRELNEPNTDPAFEEALNDIILQIASAPFGENLLEAVFNECREIIEDRARPLRRALKRAAKRRRRKRHIT